MLEPYHLYAIAAAVGLVSATLPRRWPLWAVLAAWPLFYLAAAAVRLTQGQTFSWPLLGTQLFVMLTLTAVTAGAAAFALWMRRQLGATGVDSTRD